MEVQLWRDGKPTGVSAVYSDDVHAGENRDSKRRRFNGDYTYYDQVKVVVNDEHTLTWTPLHRKSYKVISAYAATSNATGQAIVVTEIYGGAGGDARIRAELYPPASVHGEMSYHFEKGETVRMEISLNLKGSATYKWVVLYINGEKVWN
ncbi:MAG: hypothetical protein HYX96_08115 [Chloroflexi bacterium]|nr:hypothetical protein [Chloroflexota bacterium]